MHQANIHLNQWQPDNPQWMKKRTEEWAHIKANLNKMHPQIPRRSQRFHKQLFFYGIVDPILSDLDAMMRENIDPPFPGNLAFFKMWYLPQPSATAFKEIFEVEERLSALSRSRSTLFQVFKHTLFTTDYGMCGGREELMVKTFIPDYDHQQCLVQGRNKYSLNLRPQFVLKLCVYATLQLLDDGNINRFAPGQYLWDNFNDSSERHPDLILETNFHEVSLRMCLRMILDWDDRDDAPKHLAHCAKLRATLLAGFEAGDFSPILMKYWQQEKLDYQEGKPSPTH